MSPPYDPRPSSVSVSRMSCEGILRTSLSFLWLFRSSAASASDSNSSMFAVLLVLQLAIAVDVPPFRSLFSLLCLFVLVLFAVARLSMLSLDQ